MPRAGSRVGQRGQTVNLLRLRFGGSSPPLPMYSSDNRSGITRNETRIHAEVEYSPSKGSSAL